MVDEGTFTAYSQGSQSYVDALGFIRSSSFKLVGSHATQVANILGFIEDASNAGLIRSAVTAKSVAPIDGVTAFDEAESSVDTEAGMRFREDTTAVLVTIFIPAPDVSLFLAGSRTLDVTNTQIAGIISNMDTANYTYLGNYLVRHPNRSRNQTVLPDVFEPEVDQLPDGAPDVDNEPGAQLIDPED